MSESLGGPSLPQTRRLVTEVPGPESRARLARKQAVVADGVANGLPVFVEAAEIELADGDGTRD